MEKEQIDVNELVSRTEIKCCDRCGKEVPEDVKFAYRPIDMGETICHLNSECGWWARIDITYVWPPVSYTHLTLPTKA